MKRFSYIAVHVLLTALILLNPWTSWGGNIPTTFYVDQTGGNDSNTGLATDNAWKTVAKVNAFSRTNISLQSEDYGNGAVWVLGDGSLAIAADNIIAPDGTLTAELFYEATTATTTKFLRQTLVHSVSTEYTHSIYAKAGLRTWLGLRSLLSAAAPFASFDLYNGVLGTVDAGVTAGMESIGNGWYRCWITDVSENPVSNNLLDVYIELANGVNTYAGEVGKGIYIWGGQQEVGSFPTPYIPTTTAPVTASFQPGDNILFKRGETWAEHITAPSSGTSGNVITFGSYGTGAGPLFFDDNSKTGLTIQLTAPSGRGLR